MMRINDFVYKILEKTLFLLNIVGILSTLGLIIIAKGLELTNVLKSFIPKF